MKDPAFGPAIAEAQLGGNIRPAEGWVVTANKPGLLVPPACACCGAAAADSRVERQRSGDLSIIVPYCHICLRHASRPMTQSLAVTLASCLLAGAASALLPIAWPWLAWLPFSLIVLLASMAPLGIASLVRRRCDAGHTARGRAVWWLPDGTLFCTHSAWAAQLARENQVPARVRLAREPRLGPWAWAGGVLALGAAPFFHWLHHPWVRVLNLTAREVTVLCDGHPVARLIPSSVESPEAGLEVRLPAGRHRLQAVTTTGEVVSDALVSVRSGRPHLYAPGEHEYCFWLETTHYGRREPTVPVIEPLETSRKFWVLPVFVDTWFRENPKNDPVVSTSGGVLTALRQARCADRAPSRTGF